MNKILFIIVILFFLFIYSVASLFVLAQYQVITQLENTDLVGIWEGKLKVPGIELRIVAQITQTAEGKLVATIDSPDQGVTGIPVDEVTFKDQLLHLEIKSIGGVFEGKVSADYSTVEGTWQQSGVSFPLQFERIEKAVEIKRPQEPKKPYPYIEESVKYDNSEAEITLAGTLTLPEGKDPFPVVILISGSGPQDRDEAVFGHRPFLVLADYLTRQGIAVLRFDDRGVGESTGNFSMATSRDFASDVLSGVAYLKSREEIDSQQIGLIGHSEGGLIAPMVAVQSPNIAFIVLMAGPGLTGEEILYLQNALISEAMGKSEDEIALARYYNENVYTLIKEENNEEMLVEHLTQLLTDYFNKLSEEEMALIGDPETYIKSQLESLLSPWLKYFLIYDPRFTLSKVRCPVLAINGEKDLQVPPAENLSAIEEALIKGGNKDFVISKLPGLNHLFQRAETGLPVEYAQIEETISPIALKIISDWILRHIDYNDNN